MYKPTTKSGHSMYDIASLLQKSIRRANVNLAGYAVNELYWEFGNYMWKRLLVISAEDCYGILSKEIIALKMADDVINKNRKGEDKDPICAAKAVTLLCQAKKNRDACYVACNFICVDRTLEPEEIEHVDLDSCQLTDEGIPDWVYDVHTLKGRQKGKTDLDMTIAEQEALQPLQMSMFDNADWNPYYQQNKPIFKPKEWVDIETFIASKRKQKRDYLKQLFKEGKVIEALYIAYDTELGSKEENRQMELAYKIAKAKKILNEEFSNVDEEYYKGLEILHELVNK